MTPAPDSAPDLVRAAQELEDELRRCEEAVGDACKVRLNTEKNIGRAARALKAASEHRDHMGLKVNALLSAIQAAQARAESGAARMAARAGELQSRLERLEKLQARSGEIAAAVRGVTEFAKETKEPRELLDRLVSLEDRIAAAQQEARTDDFDDVAHEISGLREMVASLRRKLGGEG